MGQAGKALIFIFYFFFSVEYDLRVDCLREGSSRAQVSLEGASIFQYDMEYERKNE